MVENQPLQFIFLIYVLIFWFSNWSHFYTEFNVAGLMIHQLNMLLHNESDYKLCFVCDLIATVHRSFLFWCHLYEGKARSVIWQLTHLQHF